MSVLSEFCPRLGEALGVPDLNVDEAGAIDLIFEDTLQVQIIEIPDTSEIVYRSNIGALPENADRAGVFATLLQANYRWGVTARGHLSLDLDGVAVELIRRETTKDLTYETFEDDLSDFVQCANYWQAYLAGALPETETAAEPSAAEQPEATGIPV